MSLDIFEILPGIASPVIKGIIKVSFAAIYVSLKILLDGWWHLKACNFCAGFGEHFEFFLVCAFVIICVRKIDIPRFNNLIMLEATKIKHIVAHPFNSGVNSAFAD